MKYRVDAIDSEGRRRSEVARADSEDELREAFLAEGLFAKRITPADESEKLTFASRSKVEQRLAAKRELTDPIRVPSEGGDTTILHHGERRISGRIGVVGESLVFQADDPEDSIRLGFDRVESSRIVGFPARVLSVVTIDGDIYEFAAGFALAGRVFKEIAERS